MQLKRLFLVLTIGFSGFTAAAQQKWNLRSIVDYAMSNNITVKLSDVQARQAQLTYRQSKLSQYPNATFSGSSSYNSGNNQDPVTFSRVAQGNLSAGAQLQTSVDIFNFYSRRNTIAANNWELQAAKANVDKLKNDIALTVANAYLQILLSKEQENITLVQVQQTAAQLSNTKKLVDAGALPPLNLTQLQAQLAVDSGNYITAKGNVVQNTLTLKAYMNIDPAAPFEVETPSVESIPLEPIEDLQPENVYALALKNQPLQRYNDLRIKAAEKNKAAARGAMYPTVSVFGSLSSNYLGFKKIPNYNKVFSGYDSTGLIVNNGGTVYNVQTPVFEQGTTLLGYTKPGTFTNQFSDNFRQAIGLGITVPIFNGNALRTNYERSKLNIMGLNLQKEQDDQNLKQNIFQAYNSVLIALEKFNAGKRSVEASELTYEYAKKRFDVGMLGTFDLISTQNNVLTAKLEYTINRFDYVFKMKVLEFYKGQGLKL